MAAALARQLVSFNGKNRMSVKYRTPSADSREWAAFSGPIDTTMCKITCLALRRCSSFPTEILSLVRTPLIGNFFAPRRDVFLRLPETDRPARTHVRIDTEHRRKRCLFFSRSRSFGKPSERALPAPPRFCPKAFFQSSSSDKFSGSAVVSSSETVSAF